MKLKIEPLLEHSEINSAVWQKIKRHIESKIAEKRESNDQISLSSEKTSAIRGEIKALKDLIQAVEPKQYNIGKDK